MPVKEAPAEPADVSTGKNSVEVAQIQEERTPHLAGITSILYHLL